MALLFDSGIFSVEGLSGEILAGAKLYWYATGTSTPQATYSDEALTTPNANPVVANADGRFPAIWLQPLDYKMILKSFDDTTLVTRDPIVGALTGGDMVVTADSISDDTAALQAISDKVSPYDRYQHSAAAPTYLTIKNKLKEGVSIQNFGGVIGNATANTTAFNDFAEAVEDTGFGKLKIPYGTWEINDAVDLAPNSLATGMEIEGDHKEYSLITVNGDIAMFTHGSGLKVRNLGFRQLGTSGTGRAFSTTSTGEASYCSYEACDFYDFKFGILHRKSIWNSFRNLGLFECKAGIRLARNDSYTDQTNPNASSGWNTGWYNNQIVFDNIVVDGGGSGEVGIWAAGMGLTLNTVTVQGLDGTGGSNVVLPSGEVATGIWLDGGQTSDMSWNNVLLNIYAENTRRPLKFVDQRHVLVDGFFLQGSAVGTPFEYGVHLVNATATLQAVTGQDYFENMAKLESSSTLYGRLPGFGTVSNYDADSTSDYYNNEHQVESFTKKFTFSKTDSSTTTTFTVPVDFQDTTSYRVTINGYTDSSPDSNKRQVAYDISRINSATSTSKDISSGTETNFSSAIVGRNIVFTVTTALRFDATVTVEKFGEFPSQSAVITGV